MATPTEAASRATYHHGELPDALMSLAIEHIETKGTERLSLRALAREAGVSPTAPYRHFPTKKCLLAALATRGFVELETRLSEAVSIQAPVEERFVKMGGAYIQFALDNPIPYQLMFGSILADFSEYDMLHTAATKAYAVVLGQLEELIQARQIDLDVVTLGGIVWSFVHGVASLLLNGMNRPTEADQPDIATPVMSMAALAKDPEFAIRFAFSHLLEGQK